MHAFLTLVRYKKRYIYFALCAMALHHIPLWFRRKIRLQKTLGCGQGDSFSRKADWQQYGLLVVTEEENPEIYSPSLSANQRHRILYGRFISSWWRFFGCETLTISLQPIEGHGAWDGRKAFGDLPVKTDFSGPIAVITRATIRKEKSNRFWEHVEAVSNEMRKADGYVFSVGIGETPFLKQATFSIWQSKEKMKQFAYGMSHHVEVIQKTRKENWYREDMFVRFRVHQRWGTLRGIDPLASLFEKQA